MSEREPPDEEARDAVKSHAWERVDQLLAERAEVRKLLERPIAAEGRNLPLKELAEGCAELANAAEQRSTEARHQLERHLAAAHDSKMRAESAEGECAVWRIAATKLEGERNGLRKMVAELEARLVDQTQKRVLAERSECERAEKMNVAMAALEAKLVEARAAAERHHSDLVDVGWSAAQQEAHDSKRDALRIVADVALALAGK
jgi:hypothetical protein